MFNLSVSTMVIKRLLLLGCFFFKVFQYVDILMYHMHLDTFISIKCGLQMNNFGNLNILGFPSLVAY